jgi:hypothetical protein
MYYNNDVEIFLSELKNYIKEKAKLKQSSVNTYLRKIKKILESGHTVSDLCGGVDRLLEDYSRGGNKYDEYDHGNTKAALNQVRKMIKGDVISSLYISYQEGHSVWSRKNEHVTEYCIKDEKIAFSFNTGRKKIIHKISPTNIAKLIYILQEAERKSFLCDQHLQQFTEPSLSVTDAQSPSTYKYTIESNSGVCFDSLLIDSKNPKRMSLQNQYDQLICQIIAPYKL